MCSCASDKRVFSRARTDALAAFAFRAMQLTPVVTLVLLVICGVSARCTRVHVTVATGLSGSDKIALVANAVAVQACHDTPFSEFKQQLVSALAELELPADNATSVSFYVHRSNPGVRVLSGVIPDIHRQLPQADQAVFTNVHSFSTMGTLADCLQREIGLYNSREQPYGGECVVESLLYAVKDSAHLSAFIDAHMAWITGSPFKTQVQQHAPADVLLC